MDCKMEIFMFVLCVIPAIVTSITIISNGNSPEIKMTGGMMVDIQKGFIPVTPNYEESTVRNNIEKSKKTNSKLSINERYRRLIPYMTFYYANDLATQTTADPKDVEVEKAEIVEEAHLEVTDQRQPKKIIYSPNRSIPRYQGNRLTQHNIASANPTKLFYKTVPVYQIQSKVTQNYNPLLMEYRVTLGSDFDSGRFTPNQVPKSPSFYTTPTRKPVFNVYNDDTPNIRYYLSEKDQSPTYKLVPYEQTPPHKVVSQNDNVYDITKKPVPVSVLTPKEQVYLKTRPARPHYVYETVNVRQPIRKQPAIISESYFEKQRPSTLAGQPIVHSGFKPLLHAPPLNTETIYTTSIPQAVVSNIDHNRQQIQIETAPLIRDEHFKPNYYQYVIDQTTTYQPPKATSSSGLSLASLLNSLQLNKSIPKPITKENVGSSIQTLLQVLNILKASPQNGAADGPVLSTPKPFVAPKVVTDFTVKPVVAPATDLPIPASEAEDLHEQTYLAEVDTPSQHLDDIPSGGSTSQHFPLQQTSDDEGGTPGQPGVDYPILSIIPPTKFDCKTQRYKGFFADPDTRCQVWHYCDLNGGQASFLCPNGTIFSQAALTCDWWHNVRCASTAQLYVLNESLYKYILPHSPKFPEDYSGPLVDKYLTLKFKEMEEEFRKNKKKNSASDKMDDDSTEDSEETDESAEKEPEKESGKGSVSAVSEASVIVESPGTSGQVERLRDD